MEHNTEVGHGILAPSQRALEKRFKSWHGVCKWAGLEYSRLPAHPDKAPEEAAIAEVGAALEADAELRAAWEVRGLPVLKVYTPEHDKRFYYVIR